MAFKNLEDRFNAKMADLYNHGSTTDSSTPGVQNLEPFIEIKPNDPTREDRLNASFMNTDTSVARDTTRISDLLASPRGQQFLLNQKAQQSANTFDESREVDSKFVSANLTPGAHSRRPLSVAGEMSLSGDTLEASPASDHSAGRLHVATGNEAKKNVAGQLSGVLSVLNVNSLIPILTTFATATTKGIYGVNKRPELDVNGNYYSVLSLQKATVNRANPLNDLKKVQSSLSSGDLGGALANIGNAASKAQTLLNGVTGQADPYDSDAFAGVRYGLTSASTNRSYLKDAIAADGTPNFSFLVRPLTTPSGLHTDPPTGYSQEAIDAAPSALNFSISATDTVQGFLNRQITTATNAISNFVNKGGSIVGQLLNLTSPIQGTVTETDRLQYPNTSLSHRYDTDTRMDTLKNILAAQQASSLAYWQARQSNTGVVYDTVLGVESGGPVTIINGAPNKSVRYITDKMNLAAIYANPDGSTVTDDLITKTIRDNAGIDLIDVQFFDFVNAKTIPFRAYISNIAESVTPDTNDTRYIGRIERNIVYTGVTRELSFQLYVHALSDLELQGVWDKINYMTGLCYPATYVSGFMVPPFIKLTIGNYYRDQPGYIRTLSYQIENNTSWEISEDAQVPHGITMSITFAVIEKNQMSTGAQFYDFATVDLAPSNDPPPVELLYSGQDTSLSTTDPNASPDPYQPLDPNAPRIG